jgi:hypothetical protein
VSIEYYIAGYNFPVNSNYLSNGDMEVDSYWELSGAVGSYWFSSSYYYSGSRSLGMHSKAIAYECMSLWSKFLPEYGMTVSCSECVVNMRTRSKSTELYIPTSFNWWFGQSFHLEYEVTWLEGVGIEREPTMPFMSTSGSSANSDFFCKVCFTSISGPYKLELLGGVGISYTSNVMCYAALPITRYLKYSRSGSTLNLDIFTNSSRTILEKRLTLTNSDLNTRPLGRMSNAFYIDYGANPIWNGALRNFRIVSF